MKLGIMTNLAIFEFENQEIRFVDGKPVGNDVALALGYQDPSDAIYRKVKTKNKTLCKTQTVDGKNREVMVLEEAGIYQLIFGSKLASAEAFQDWIFEQVLPAIRKTGKYELKPQKDTSSEWLIERKESKEVRRELTDCIKDYITRHPEMSANKCKFLYSNATEALNLGLFAKKSKALKQLIGITPSASFRDYLGSNEIICLKTVEYLACQFIDNKDMYPCDAVKLALDISYSNRKFADKYVGLTAG